MTKWEQRVQRLEDEGLTRSDAQAVVDAEDAKSGRERYQGIDGAVLLERIGSRIYDDFRAKRITFEVCEASLESLSNEDVIFGIPENEDELQERLSAAYSVYLVHTGHLVERKPAKESQQ